VLWLPTTPTQSGSIRTPAIATDLANIRRLHGGTPVVTSMTGTSSRDGGVRRTHRSGATYLYDRRTGKDRFSFARGLAQADRAGRRETHRVSSARPAHDSRLSDCAEGRAGTDTAADPAGTRRPWARDDWGYEPEAQLFANRGYAVLQINYRGSTGYGKRSTTPP